MMKKTRFTPIKLLVCMMVFIGFAPASFAQTDATTPAAGKINGGETDCPC